MLKKKLPAILAIAFITIFHISCNNRTENNTSSVSESHPSWAAQSNIYEVNLRQYSAAGTLSEFEKSLPRLKEMGVEIFWFMPVTPIGLEGRKMNEKEMGSYYAVKDYKAFNPDYGTMDDWKAFVKKAQAMGFKVIVDWVANHSSPDNNWVKTHPQFYVKDSAGNLIPPFDWTDVRKLNYANRGLRDSMIAAMKFWLTETGIDGFRCDVAEQVPTDFWKECITELKKVKNVFMLAEGEKPELHTAGFDETYTWSMMHGMKALYIGEWSMKQFDSLIKVYRDSFPANAYRLYFTSNHDENSWNGTEFEKYGDAYKAFAVFTQTMYQSVPLIYSGQETMNKKRLEFFIKDTIPWTAEMGMTTFYKTMLTLRRSNPALAANASYKRLATSADSAVFAYQREKDGHTVVVVLNLSKQPQKFTINDESINGNTLNVFSAVKENISSGKEYNLQPWGFTVYNYQ
jgi:glycosidase